MSLIEPIVGRIVGENADYVRALNDSERRTQSMTSTASGHFRGLSSTISSLGSVIAGVGAGAAVAGFLRGAYTEAEEARRTLAQTNAVIASTGGVAGVSAKDVDSLSNRLSALTGIDDEAVAANENLLLTFTNVRNGVGKGNDIFNQATKATLDMSVALGQDGKTSAIQLGKALNDPIKGVTALQRVGVSFTEQQKEQIKTLVESGKTLDAQKIILGEINKEFGGSAAAAASPMARLQVAFKNLEEEVGTALMPVLATVATFLANVLPGAFSAIGRVVTPVVALIRKAADDIIGGFQNPEATIGPAIGTFERIFLSLGEGVRRVVDFVAANWPRVREIFGTVIGFVSDHLREFGVALAVLMSPIGALVAGIIYAYFHFQTFRTVVDAVVSFLKDVVLPAILTVATFIADQFGNLVGWVQRHWASIQEAIGHVIAVVQVIIETFIAIVQAGWALFGDKILAVASYIWAQIQNVIQTVVRIVGDIISIALDIINGDWGKAWHAVMDIVDAAWDFIRRSVGNGIDLVLGIVRGLPGDVMHALGNLAGLLWDAGADLLRGMINGLKSMAGALADAALAPVRAAVDGVKRFLHIGSPSKLFEGFGTNIGQGLERGMRGTQGLVAAAASGLAASSVAGYGAPTVGQFAPVAAGTAVASAGGGGRTVNVSVQIVTPTGDIPDSTIRKLRTQLFAMSDDIPAGQLLPSS